MTPPASTTDGTVDRLTDPFFALDTGWRFTYLNDAAERLLERSRADLLGRVMWDEFPETVETQFSDGFYRAMDRQVPVSFEVYHTPLETWFEVRAYPDDGGLSVFMRDITEGKERERRLAQHDAVFEAVHDGVVTLDRGNRIASVNDAIETTLEVDRGEVVGDHVERILEAASVDAEDTIEIGRAISDVDMGNATRRRLEVEFTDADGEDHVGEISLIPIDHEEVTTAAVVRDVTDRREYERVITALHGITRWLFEADDREEIGAIAVHAGSDLLSLPISGIWLLDEEYGYLDPVAGSARAHEEFGGLPRFHQGEGLVWEAFEAGEVELHADLREVEGVYDPETPLRSALIAPIGTHGVLMAGALDPDAFDETDVELVSTLAENVRSALDRADRERVLRERTERLERQTERLEAVAEIISSDLEAQLEAVAASLEDDEEWEFPLAENEVETTLHRIERLVDDVREFARNATAVGPRRRIDLETAIDDAVAASRLESAAVVVEEAATVRADPDRLVRLLGTVFDDVADRADGDVTVQVGLIGFGTSDESRGFFLCDDAEEIPPTAHEDVLEAGSDLGADGLGLAVSRAIAEAHDWSVSVSIGENGGTCFAIRGMTTLEPGSRRGPGS